jgi:alpha-galactosidase
MNKALSAVIASLLVTLGAGEVFKTFAVINNLAKTPPMGWNSWNCFGANINETQIKKIADAMLTTGLKDAGYIYLNLDDRWMATSRDASGNLQSEPSTFPKGMKELGDYIHGKGLKFGIYGDRGTETCYFRDNMKELDTKSGSYGTEVNDAKTFASWGVDYLKYDNCLPVGSMQTDYEKMRDALANSGRDIVFSICAWEFQSWMPNTGNLWRTTTDILNIWKKTDQWSWGILDIIDLNEPRASYAKPGAWNDPDMLQVGNNGNGGPTDNEYRTHFSLWCIMAAPLILGNDITTMNQATKDIILNKEVIAVDQDSAGIQGTKIKSTNGLDVWCKPLGSKTGDTKAVALFNRNDNTAEITVNFADIGLSGEVHVRDLWAKTDKGLFTGSYKMSVTAHNTAMLKISKPSAVRTERALLSQKLTRFSAQYSNGNIVVKPLEISGQFAVSVYMVDGSMMASMNSSSGAISIPVFNKNGLYIISVNHNGKVERKTISINN